VTALVLRTVAARLGLPTSVSPEELRQMIDGKLTDQGREPRDIQVVVERGTTEAKGPGRVLLQDDEGPFLDAELPTAESVESPASPVKDTHAIPSSAGVTDERDPNHEATIIGECNRLAADVERYRAEVESSRREVESSRAEVERAKNEVEGVKKRLKEVWRMSCDQLISHEEELAAKDAAIAEFNRKLLAALGTLPGADHPERVSDEGHDHSRAHRALVVSGSATGPRRGKAPAVDPFFSDDGTILLEDWLPSLERAASWNAWTDEEKVLQLAGHLHGWALQEWNLIPAEERSTFSDAVKSLGFRVNSGSHVLAGQDFRHAR